MTARFLRHVTVTSGDVRDSPRHEVSPEAIAVCQELLTAALAGPVAIPELPDVLMQAEATARTLRLVLTWRDSPILTVGVATHSRGGASLWRELIETATTPVTPLDCPAEPWVAARLELGAVLLDPDVLMALADLERCLGWGWIERVEASRASA